jgi:transcription elongation factor Elf1
MSEQQRAHLAVSVNCPWCGLEHFVYIPMDPKPKRLILQCANDEMPDCGRLFAFAVHWSPVVEYWRLLPGEDPALGDDIGLV